MKLLFIIEIRFILVYRYINWNTQYDILITILFRVFGLHLGSTDEAIRAHPVAYHIQIMYYILS